MTLTEIVDELVERYQGWNRDGAHGVLRFVDQAQQMLLSVEAYQRVVWDTANGALPSLNTTSLIYQYTLPTTFWRVGHILVLASAQVALPTWGALDYGTRLRSGRRLEYVDVGGNQYVKVPYIKTWDYVSDATPARVLFTTDPGTQTDVYKIYGWRRAIPLLSEDMALEIAPPGDVDFLIPAAGKLIEGVTNGNYDEARRIVLHELRPQMWADENAGDQNPEEPEDHGF